MKKLISWNVNGLRACVGKDFLPQMAALDAALAGCKIHGHRGVVEMAGMPRPEHR